MWDTKMIDRVKRYLSLESLPADDILIEECIDRAETHLEEWTGRWFKRRKDTRRYDCPTNGEDTLILDFDMLKTIKVGNGDGTIIPAADMRYLPANLMPKFAIRLVGDSAWTWSDTPVQAIGVRAYWGFTSEPDHYTIQAAIRLAVFLYKQKDSQVFDTTTFVDGGVIVVPQGIPKYVADFLGARTRAGVGTVA